MPIGLIKHEVIPDCGSYEVRFTDGRRSKYFYFENLPSVACDRIWSNKQSLSRTPKPSHGPSRTSSTRNSLAPITGLIQIKACFPAVPDMRRAMILPPWPGGGPVYQPTQRGRRGRARAFTGLMQIKARPGTCPIDATGHICRWPRDTALSVYGHNGGGAVLPQKETSTFVDVT